jgi:hypothetical protein
MTSQSDARLTRKVIGDASLLTQVSESDSAEAVAEAEAEAVAEAEAETETEAEARFISATTTIV